jgi:DNA polymerase-3 subunit gamma/tau
MPASPASGAEALPPEEVAERAAELLPPIAEAAEQPATLTLDLDSAQDTAAALAANADFSVLERVEASWEHIKRDVRPRSPTVQALLHSIRPIDVEGDTIVLLASSTFHQTQIENPQNRRIVEEVIGKLLGMSIAIRCTIEAKSEVRDLRGQIREARKDDLVRAAMNIFDAQIVDIEAEEEH